MCRMIVAVVEGPTEAGDHRDAVVTKMLTEVFGVTESDIDRRLWRQLIPFPRGQRKGRESPYGVAAKTKLLLDILKVNFPCYGVVFLCDNDHPKEWVHQSDCIGGSNKRQLPPRLTEMRQGVAQSRLGDDQNGVVCGVAVEMMGAGLLADPQLLREGERLPKRARDLWGDEGDPQSNHPKRVFKRLVGKPISEATADWSFERAAQNDDWLRQFVDDLKAMANARHAV